MIDPMDCLHSTDVIKVIGDWKANVTLEGTSTGTETRAAQCGSCGLPVIQARSV